MQLFLHTKLLPMYPTYDTSYICLLGNWDGGLAACYPLLVNIFFWNKTRSFILSYSIGLSAESNSPAIAQSPFQSKVSLVTCSSLTSHLLGVTEQSLSISLCCCYVTHSVSWALVSYYFKFYRHHGVELCTISQSELFFTDKCRFRLTKTIL